MNACNVMKRTIVIAFLLLLLLAGCRQERAVSPRLVELDSLIAVAPDSAAALLQAIPSDSLHGAENRAYHALLTTQAKYKAYIPATSDSTINVAIDHYFNNQHGDYDRRIRTLIYKGCVMTELNQPDSALYWFKVAESAAHTDDHANLGYINLRLASLYSYEAMNDSLCIFYYKTALGHYQNLPVNNYQVSAAINLGAIYSMKDHDKSKSYFQMAMKMSKVLGDSTYAIQLLEQMVLSAIQNDNYPQAQNYAKQAITMGDQSLDIYAYATIIFSRIHMNDSAYFYLSNMPQPVNRIDSMNYHRAQAEYARTLNKMEDYVYHDDLAGYISDAIFLDAKQQELIEAENQYEKQLLQSRLEKAQLRFWFIVCLVALVTLAAIYLLNRLRQQVFKRRLAEDTLQQTIGQLSNLRQAYTRQKGQIDIIKTIVDMKENEVNQMSESIAQKEGEISRMGEAISQKEGEISRMSETIAQKENEVTRMSDKIAQKEREIGYMHEKVLQGEAVINSMKTTLRSHDTMIGCLDDILGELHTLQKIKHWRKFHFSDSFWEKLEQYVRACFSNILDDKYQLNEKQRMFLCLCCINVPLETSAFMLNLSPKTLYNYRPAIARIISDNQTSVIDDAIERFKFKSNGS